MKRQRSNAFDAKDLDENGMLSNLKTHTVDNDKYAETVEIQENEAEDSSKKTNSENEKSGTTEILGSDYEDGEILSDNNCECEHSSHECADPKKSENKQHIHIMLT